MNKRFSNCELDVGLFDVRAIYSFKSSDPGELTFKKGAEITVTEVVDDNWYYGNVAGANQGMFPSSYVIKIEPEPELIEECDMFVEEDPDQGGSLPDSLPSSTPPPAAAPDQDCKSGEESEEYQDYELYIAQYNYSPKNTDELELLRGDVVEVIERCEDGWFVGTSQRTEQFGTFPGNYVLPHDG